MSSHGTEGKLSGALPIRTLILSDAGPTLRSLILIIS